MPDKTSCLWFCSMRLLSLTIYCLYFGNSVPATEIIKGIGSPVPFFRSHCSHKKVWVPSNGVELLKFFLVIWDSGHFLFHLEWNRKWSAVAKIFSSDLRFRSFSVPLGWMVFSLLYVLRKEGKGSIFISFLVISFHTVKKGWPSHSSEV